MQFGVVEGSYKKREEEYTLCQVTNRKREEMGGWLISTDFR